MRKHYDSDLTDSQWQAIKPLFHWQRKRQHDLRFDILDGLFFLVKTGCQWRMLSGEFAPWQTVYYYYRTWKQQGLMTQILDTVRAQVRLKAGREATPSAAVIDAQSVKTGRVGGAAPGYDGHKHVKGRKRHIVTDTLGLLLAVVVHAANLHESLQAERVLNKLKGKFPRLAVKFADQGYAGTLAEYVQACFGWLLEVVGRPEGQRGFQVLPKRWVVERTFSWFEGFRRLSKDYEFLPESSETMVELAMTRLMLKRL